MDVVTLVPFHDKDKDVWRSAGDEFAVTRERFKQINSVGMDKVGEPLVREIVRKAVAKGMDTPEKRASKRQARAGK